MVIRPKGKAISEIRIRRGLSKNALSKKAGVCKSSIAQVENGQPPTPRIAKAISDALEVGFDELFEIVG